MLNLDIAQALSTLAVASVPAMLGIILHEVAHGWMAARCGDPTAKILGRLTVNPLPHIDMAGLLVFVLTSLSGSFVFGWAKPVPVDPRYFRNPAKHMMLVALAGPLTNFLLAVVFGILLWGVLTLFPPLNWQQSTTYIFVLKALQAGIVINFGLGWLNLLPVPPLDGSKIVAYFLPGKIALSYLRMERYGFLLLLLLLFTGALGMVLGPLVSGSAMGLLNLLDIL
ncbi:MAG: site-2 protease family protein [Desulfovibrio sp.]|nr:site-2 protease family protein [Desulfovibrio sp.]